MQDTTQRIRRGSYQNTIVVWTVRLLSSFQHRSTWRCWRQRSARESLCLCSSRGTLAITFVNSSIIVLYHAVNKRYSFTFHNYPKIPLWKFSQTPWNGSSFLLLLSVVNRPIKVIQCQHSFSLTRSRNLPVPLLLWLRSCFLYKLILYWGLSKGFFLPLISFIFTRNYISLSKSEFYENGILNEYYLLEVVIYKCAACEGALYLHGSDWMIMVV